MMNEHDKMTQRKVVTCFGATLATAGIKPVFGLPSAPTLVPTGLEDPTTKYPKPPFKPQLQPWPGLASSKKIDVKLLQAIAHGIEVIVE